MFGKVGFKNTHLFTQRFTTKGQKCYSKRRKSMNNKINGSLFFIPI